MGRGAHTNVFVRQILFSIRETSETTAKLPTGPSPGGNLRWLENPSDSLVSLVPPAVLASARNEPSHGKRGNTGQQGGGQGRPCCSEIAGIIDLEGGYEEGGYALLSLKNALRAYPWLMQHSPPKGSGMKGTLGTLWFHVSWLACIPLRMSNDRGAVSKPVLALGSKQTNTTKSLRVPCEKTHRPPELLNQN